MTAEIPVLPDTDCYAVVGHPVAHSLSPRIHSLFAEQTSQQLSYGRADIATGDFASAVSAFRDAGGRGINVTVPYKGEAFAFASRLSERASRAQAVNTLQFDTNGDIRGDNTDGIGLVRDLAANHGCPVRGLDILILGAGGAVAGILGPLLDEQPTRIRVANRTVERAQELASRFDKAGTIEASGYEALSGQQFDLIINGTSASLAGDIPPLPEQVLRPGGVCYDLMYASEPTVFMQWAESHAAGQVMDGLGMLVEQAAEAFMIWRGVMPSTQPVIETLRG